VRKIGTGNVRGPRSCEINVYIIWVQGVWRREMLKVKVVVAMRMAAGKVGRRDVGSSADSEQTAR